MDRRSEVVRALSRAQSAPAAARELKTSTSTVYKWAAGDLGREAHRVALANLRRRERTLLGRSHRLDVGALQRGVERLHSALPWILRYKGQLRE